MPVRSGYEIDRLGVNAFPFCFSFSQVNKSKGDELMKSLVRLIVSLMIKIAFIALIYAIVMGLTTYS